MPIQIHLIGTAYSFQSALKTQLMAITTTEASDQNRKLPYQASTLRSSVNGTIKQARTITTMAASSMRLLIFWRTRRSTLFAARAILCRLEQQSNATRSPGGQTSRQPARPTL